MSMHRVGRQDARLADTDATMDVSLRHIHRKGVGCDVTVQLPPTHRTEHILSANSSPG
jgi:hypothetical protein